ncbi:MAG TPA: hypothetical protein VFS08_19415 [Gemmatimonadaceae bacterium]|nr:hypothetical protein [Gemmatimonadaceae bacterium]
MPAPANAPAPAPFAASAFVLQRAEELLSSLPGVISARIMADDGGTISEIHVLTTLDVAPKQTVRNIESALIAHLGVRVDHRKISVATTVEAPREFPRERLRVESSEAAPPAEEAKESSRRLYFEDVEVQRSRAKGVTCRVTLRKGDASFTGEAEGMEHERARIELAARATLAAIAEAEGLTGLLALEGVRNVAAFDREFAFVAVTARLQRMTALLTGTCEIRESLETAGALAVLDATNRWLAHGR